MYIYTDFAKPLSSIMQKQGVLGHGQVNVRTKGGRTRSHGAMILPIQQTKTLHLVMVRLFLDY